MQKDSRRLPPLDLLASFEAAARHLSFTKAGAERFITQSAMSRQIQALEDDLGVALFRRRHRALSLTDDGQRLLATCTTVLQQLRDTVHDLRAPAQRQVLALSTTPGLASLWLIPRLPRFTSLHPGIDVRIDATLEPRKLKDEGFDLVIRYGVAGRSPGELLFSEAFTPVCSPRLLRAGPPLVVPQDLARHTLLQQAPDQHGGGPPVEWDLWLQSAGVPGLRPAAVLSFTAYDTAITAALSGQGVALGRRPLVDALLRARKLVAPFEDTVATPRAYYLIAEPQAAQRQAVQALVTWLQDEAARTAVRRDEPKQRAARPRSSSPAGKARTR